MLGVLLPVNPLLGAVVAGPVAGLANRVYDAELAVGFLAATLVAGGLAVAVGRARERFGADRRAG